MIGSVTVTKTYAGSLNQVASKVFWVAATINKSIIVVVVVTANAFAKAGTPKSPLFVTVDKRFHEWYKSRYPN